MIPKNIAKDFELIFQATREYIHIERLYIQKNCPPEQPQSKQLNLKLDKMEEALLSCLDWLENPLFEITIESNNDILLVED